MKNRNQIILSLFFLILWLVPCGYAETTITVSTNVLMSDVPRIGTHMVENYYQGALLKHRVAVNFEGTRFRRMHGTILRTNGVYIMWQDATGIPMADWDWVITNSDFRIVSDPAKGETGKIVSMANQPIVYKGKTENWCFLTFDNPITVPPEYADEEVGIMIYSDQYLAAGYVGNPSKWNVSSNNIIVTNDCAPGSFGNSSCRMDGTSYTSYQQYQALEDGGTTINTSWRIGFWIKKDSGSPTVTCDLYSSGTTSENITVPDTWEHREVVLDMSADKMVAARIQVDGGSILIDDITCEQIDGPSNQVWRTEAMDLYREFNPGVLRAYTAGGMSIEDQLKPSLETYGFKSAAWTDFGVYEDQEKETMSLQDACLIAEELGCALWYNTSGTIFPWEITNMIEFLAGPTNTTWGKARADQGHPEPWTDTLKEIQIEIGNEAWNTYPDYAFKGYDGPDYWNDIVNTAKSSPYYTTNIIMQVASQAGNELLSAEILADCTNIDRYAVGPYTSRHLFDTDRPAHGSDENFFKWYMSVMLYDALDPNGRVGLHRSQMEGIDFSFYEVNVHTTPSNGDAPAEDFALLTPSLAQGIGVANYSLLNLKEHSVRWQNFFNFTGRANYAPALLFGMMHDMKPGIQHKRPIWYANVMMNKVRGGNLMETIHSGDDPEFISYGRFDDGNNESAPWTSNQYQTVYSYAFENNGTNGLVLFNYDLTATQDVQLVFLDYVQNETAESWLLTSDSYSNHNETVQEAVASVYSTVSDFKSGIQLSLPPCTELVLKWETSEFLPSLPTAPSDLSATNVQLDRIDLVWTDNSSNEVWFVVDRRLSSSSNYTELATVFATNYTDNTMIDGSEYVYRVRAYNLAGYSGESTCPVALPYGGDRAVEPLADAETYSSSPDVNYGTSATINDGATRHIHLKFDMLSIGGTVTSATVRLYHRDYGDTVADITLYALTNGWAEDTLTWNNQPVFGEQLVVTTGVADNAWLEFDITDYIQTLADDPDTNTVVSFAVDSSLFSRYSSKENSDGNAPQLYLNYGGPGKASIQTSVSAVSVPEGSTNTFGVRLPQQPAASTTVTVARVDGGDTNITVQGDASLVFTTNNWSSYQTVTLDASEDADEFDGEATIRLSVDGMLNRDVTATEADNDQIQVVVSTNAITVLEGSTATYDVRLNSAPSGSITVNTTNVEGDTNIEVQGGAELVFDSGNWNGWRTVTLAATTDEDVVNGWATLRSDGPGLLQAELTATESDNNTLTILVSTTAVSVPEDSTAAFNVKLSHQPGGSITVSTARISGDTNLSVQSGSTSRVFTTSNWNSWQAVTLAAAEDGDILNGSATNRCSSPGLSDVDVVATEVDNDTAAVIVSSSAVNISEGFTATFDIKLSYDPGSEATVTVARLDGGDTDISIQSDTSLVFDSGSWNIWQTVTLAAEDDPDSINGSATIRGSAPGMTLADVTATEVENDGPMTFFSEPMDSDPGWATSGLWAFGVPTGQGGAYGSADPTAGYTSTNVYGYNLSGDYENSITVTNWLTTSAIDCSNYTNVTLAFQRWLGVESPSYDHAHLEVSTDGANWNSLWQNSVRMDAGSWEAVEYNLSTAADEQSTVYLRWGLGKTDDSWQFCGWNIDDITLVGNYIGTDMDSDGLPDSWEQQHYGGATNANPAATASNGVNTVEEAYIAGISPVDPDAFFLISDLSPLVSESILEWTTAPGRVYSIYWTSNLLSGFGIPMHTNYSGGAFTDSTHGAENEGFYKIEVEME